MLRDNSSRASFLDMGAQVRCEQGRLGAPPKQCMPVSLVYPARKLNAIWSAGMLT